MDMIISDDKVKEIRERRKREADNCEFCTTYSEHQEKHGEDSDPRTWKPGDVVKRHNKKFQVIGEGVYIEGGARSTWYFATVNLKDRTVEERCKTSADTKIDIEDGYPVVASECPKCGERALMHYSTRSIYRGNWERCLNCDYEAQTSMPTG